MIGRVLIVFSLVVGVVTARADYYPYYGSYGSHQSTPIISLELDAKKSLNSAFRIAAREGRMEDIRRYLIEGADVNSRSDEGVTALMYAARDCSIQMLDFLLGNGASPNLSDDEGRVALVYSIRESCAEAVETLLRVPSIRLNVKDRSGRTLLDYAIDMAQTDVGGAATQIEGMVREALERQDARRKKRSSTDSHHPRN